MKKIITAIAVCLCCSSLFAQDKTTLPLDRYTLSVPSDLNVTKETLYTIQRLQDSTAVQFMQNADGSITYRKVDAEVKKWTEWIPLPADGMITGRAILLNGTTYTINEKKGGKASD